MGNKQFAALSALAAAVVMTVAPAGARATEAVDCIGLISGLKDDTNAAAFKSEKDRSGLVSKLDSATSKLAATKGPKIADATVAMQAYDSKVVTLYGDGKVPQATYSLLHDGYDLSSNTSTGWGSQQVLTCIANIGL
jgi:hypothetical protein